VGKVAESIITGYWPDRVPRRIGIPQQPLPKLLARGASWVQDGRALLRTRERTLSYQEFYAEAGKIAAGLIASVPPNSSIGVIEPASDRATTLLVAGLLAGCKVAILDAGQPEMLAHWNASAPPAVLLTHTRGPHHREFSGTVLTTQELLECGESTQTDRRPVRWRDVAIRIPSEDVLVSHSHYGISAMVTSMTTFVPLIAELDFVHEGPLSTWDGLSGTITALISGRGVIIDPGEWSDWDPGSAYGILTRAAANRVVETGEVPAYLPKLRLLFVKITNFDVQWRKRLEGALNRVVLPIYGAPEFGPVVAAHPTWAPAEVHGLPLVNVSIVPVDPVSGEPSEVPWNLLTQAELGIESPSNLTYASSAHLEGRVLSWKGNSVVRTGKKVVVDRLGFVRFLDV
jgi:hypothetical protein